MAKTSHECENLCGETCDCDGKKGKCTYCSNCTDDVTALSQCDYCTNRATLECEGCGDLFWCVDHEDSQPDMCDTCRIEEESEEKEEEEDEDEEE